MCYFIIVAERNLEELEKNAIFSILAGNGTEQNF